MDEENKRSNAIVNQQLTNGESKGVRLSSERGSSRASVITRLAPVGVASVTHATLTTGQWYRAPVSASCSGGPRSGYEATQP